MKIAAVEALVLRQKDVDDRIADGSQDDLLIRITTEDGIVGYGEVDSSPEVVKAAIDAPNSHANAMGLRHVLLGQDARDIDGLWRRMYRASIYYGRRGPAVHAMSGIDIALWDIKGKAAGKPVHALLGGAKRKRVKAYASTLMPETEAEVRGVVERLGRAGFRAIKLGWGPLGKDAVHDVRLCRAAVEAGAGAIEILIDAGLGYGADATRALPVARALEEMGVVWLEEPFEPDALDAYRQLADAVGLRIASGEHEATRWGFLELVERGGVDVVQPDVTRCGGIGESLRIAELAAARGALCVPHAWKSGIIKAASLQVNAVLPEALYQEYCVAETPIARSLTRETFPLDSEGFVAVPETPGIGVEIDQDFVARYAVG